MLEDAPTVENDPENGGPSKEAMEAVKNLERAWPDMQDRVKKLAEMRQQATAEKAAGDRVAAAQGVAGAAARAAGRAAGRAAAGAGDGGDAGIGAAARRAGWADDGDVRAFDDYYDLSGIEYLGAAAGSVRVAVCRWFCLLRWVHHDALMLAVWRPRS